MGAAPASLSPSDKRNQAGAQLDRLGRSYQSFSPPGGARGENAGVCAPAMTDSPAAAAAAITPERLAAYARQFGAGPQWHFLTGTPQASQAVQRAFDTWRGDKMNHPLVTFVRPAGAQRWVRLEGHATATDLLRELRAPTT